MIGPYLIKNPLLYGYLRCIDLVCKVLRVFGKARPCPDIPDNILVIQWAHMGDAIIATSILPLLRKAYPRAKIGMLINSCSVPILQKHPLVDKLHVFDHPKIVRKKKVLNYLKTPFFLWRILQEIRKQKYDLSIDVYCFYPNSQIITWLAQIPKRLGYISGGGGPLLTHRCCWSGEQKHMSLYHVDLLKLLHIHIKKQPFFKSSLQPVPKEVFSALQKKWCLPEKYIIFHPCSGNSKKDCSIDTWTYVIHNFCLSNETIVVTGDSRAKQKIHNYLLGISPNKIINLVGETSFEEFHALVLNAFLVICSDTMVGHLAGVYDIPSVVVFLKKEGASYWKPASSNVRVVFDR